MPEIFTLLTAILTAGIVGWLLASFLKARTVAGELARSRADFEARLAEQGRIVSARDAELTTARSTLAETHDTLTSVAEDRARLAAFQESGDRAAAERAE